MGHRIETAKYLIREFKKSPVWQNKHSRHGFIASQVCFFVSILMSISNWLGGTIERVTYIGGGLIVMACGVYVLRLINELQREREHSQHQREVWETPRSVTIYFEDGTETTLYRATIQNSLWKKEMTKKAVRVEIQYDDGTSIELSPDLVDNTTDKDTAQQLWESFDGGLHAVRLMLGLPKGFKISEALQCLDEEGPDSLREKVENFDSNR